LKVCTILYKGWKNPKSRHDQGLYAGTSPSCSPARHCRRALASEARSSYSPGHRPCIRATCLMGRHHRRRPGRDGAHARPPHTGPPSRITARCTRPSIGTRPASPWAGWQGGKAAGEKVSGGGGGIIGEEEEATLS
jgi:hypothetical protein